MSKLAQDALKYLTKAGLTKKNVLTVFWPVCYDFHWWGIRVIRRLHGGREPSVTLLDSLGSFGPEPDQKFIVSPVAEALLYIVEAITKAMFETKLDIQCKIMPAAPEDETPGSTIKIPQQDDGVSCGPLLVENFNQLGVGMDLTVGQAEVPFMRQRHALIITAFPDDRDGMLFQLCTI